MVRTEEPLCVEWISVPILRKFSTRVGVEFLLFWFDQAMTFE
jgi:hypothetical protein